MRRPIIIAVSALALLVVGIGAYWYFFSGSSVAVTPSVGTSTSLPSAGQGSAQTPAAQNPAVALPSAAAEKVNSRLVEIAAGPIVPGLVAVDASSTNSTGSSTPDIAISFIERQSGNLYRYLVRAGTLTRTSNKTIPGIEDAYWLPDGSRVYAQYLSGSDFSTVNTYSLAADGSNGFFLPQNLAGLDTALTSLFTLASDANGSSANVSRTDGTKPAQVFSTPLSAIRASFAGAKQYLVFTKPSASLAGNAYLVNSSGAFSHIAGPLYGLVALASPDGKWALVSYATSGTMHLELVNTSDDSATQLPVATIADTCVWAPDSSAAYCGIPVSPDASYAYPDDWYQGAVHFNDRIWKIDVTGRFASLVLDFGTQTNGGALDATALAVDKNQQVLTFVNKNDGSLWAYSL